ncbi:hypothetical protein Droror1_Dr00019238 [Drosera rotundifolia]
MKFSESPAVELRVGNEALSIQQDNSTMHVGTTVWQSSLVLVKFADRWSSISDSPYSDLLDFRSKRGIEIGSGCGVAGMGLSLLGLTDLVLTDIDAVMPALKHNLKRNKHVLKRLPKTARLYWGKKDQIEAVRPPFDVVIAADVVYLEETVANLVETMEMLVKENGVVLLGYQVRSVEADRLFWEMCGRVFGVVEKVKKEDLDSEYRFEETDVFVLRKKR